MKKILWVLAFLVIVGMGLVATCPDRADHQRAVAEVADQALKEKIGSGGGLVESGLRILGKMFAGSVADVAVDQLLTVDNYYVVSIGRIEFNGKSHIVSVGLLNHIFTADKDQLLEKVEEW
ncbi:MAG: DUF4359 domain-containing protein [Prevotella sp.]|nr:DUF4359 domain-containing protein [Prevotella sp.]